VIRPTAERLGVPADLLARLIEQSDHYGNLSAELYIHMTEAPDSTDG
jgi:hypothetical protein